MAMPENNKKRWQRHQNVLKVSALEVGRMNKKWWVFFGFSKFSITSIFNIYSEKNSLKGGGNKSLMMELYALAEKLSGREAGEIVLDVVLWYPSIHASIERAPILSCGACFCDGRAPPTHGNSNLRPYCLCSFFPSSPSSRITLGVEVTLCGGWYVPPLPLTCLRPFSSS